MRQTTSQTRWQRYWRPALVFGLPLGLLDLGFFAASMTYSSRLLPQQAVPICVLLYLLIPAIAGYQFCYHGRHEGREGSRAGFRVGLVGSAAAMLGTTLLFAVLFLRYVTMPRPFNPRMPHQWGLYDPARELNTMASVLGILAVLHGIGVLLSLIGGRTGGALAAWRPLSRVHPGEEARS